jgi:hypothetical protein
LYVYVVGNKKRRNDGIKCLTYVGEKNSIECEKAFINKGIKIRYKKSATKSFFLIVIMIILTVKMES